MSPLFRFSDPRNLLGNSAYYRLWIFSSACQGGIQTCQWKCHKRFGVHAPDSDWGHPQLQRAKAGQSRLPMHYANCLVLRCYNHLYTFLVFYDTNLNSTRWGTLEQFIAGCQCRPEKWLGLKARVVWAKPDDASHLIFIRKCSWTMQN